MIELIDVNKSFGNKEIYSDLNLHIQKGEFVQIVGESGSGKSTLLNLLGLLDNKYQGKILIDNINTKECSDEQISSIRNNYLGYIFQSYNLISNMTAYENIFVPFIYSKLQLNKMFYDKIDFIIEKLNIKDILYKKVQYLSGGEKQRVAIARAISLSPKIIFADEPTGNLDDKNSNVVFSILKELHQSGKTIILVTHNTYINTGATRVLHISDRGLK